MNVRLVVLFWLILSPPAWGAEIAGLPATKPVVDQAAFDKLGWHLGSQAYTFRKLTLNDTLDVLSALGVRYVEIYPGQKWQPAAGGEPVSFDHNSPPMLADEFLAKCKATNVTPVAYGVVQLSNDEAQSRKVFEFAKKLGLQTITSEPRPDSAELLDKLANEYQINVAIHNHPQPSLYWNPDAVLKFCEGRSARIGACADVGHWARSGLVPAECLKKLEGKIISYHLKDIDDKKVDVLWGTGKCDFPSLLVETKRQGIHPLMSIEYESSEGAELIANVTKCIEYLDKQVTQLAKGNP